MTADVVVDLGDGYSPHIASSIDGVTLCGRAFADVDVDELVDRDAYIDRRIDDGEKPSYCFDCLVVDDGGSVHPRRREIHFTGGPA